MADFLSEIPDTLGKIAGMEVQRQQHQFTQLLDMYQRMPGDLQMSFRSTLESDPHFQRLKTANGFGGIPLPITNLTEMDAIKYKLEAQKQMLKYQATDPEYQNWVNQNAIKNAKTEADVTEFKAHQLASSPQFQADQDLVASLQAKRETSALQTQAPTRLAIASAEKQQSLTLENANEAVKLGLNPATATPDDIQQRKNEIRIEEINAVAPAQANARRQEVQAGFQGQIDAGIPPPALVRTKEAKTQMYLPYISVLLDKALPQDKAKQKNIMDEITGFLVQQSNLPDVSSEEMEKQVDQIKTFLSKPPMLRTIDDVRNIAKLKLESLAFGVPSSVPSSAPTPGQGFWNKVFTTPYVKPGGRI